MNKFTDKQLKEFLNAFCVYDSTNLGYVRSSKLREMLKSIGYNPTENGLDKITSLIDQEGDGKVHFTEFVDLIDSFETEEKELNDAKAAFNVFDFMGKGYVLAHEIEEALIYTMERSTEEENKEKIIKFFKLHQKKKIYFRDFVEMITVKRVR